MSETKDSYADAISSIEEIIEDARNGRMFILVDHEDRENEGDLVIPSRWQRRRRSISWRPMGGA